MDYSNNCRYCDQPTEFGNVCTNHKCGYSRPCDICKEYTRFYKGI